MRILAFALVVYALYAGALFLLQRRMMYPIRGSSALTSSGAGEQLWIETKHGRTELWLLPPLATLDSGPAPLFIFAHGNAEVIDYVVNDFDPMRKLGVAVALIEYPGYGRSSGRPSQRAITETFVTGYDQLVARPDIDARRVIVYGRSLGGGVASALADERPVAALVLQSTFTSVRAFAKQFLLPGFLVRDPFDNVDALTRFEGPVLVVHGRHDDQIPYAHARALVEAAPNATLISYECSHNDCPPDWAVFWSDVTEFLGMAGLTRDD